MTSVRDGHVARDERRRGIETGQQRGRRDEYDEAESSHGGPKAKSSKRVTLSALVQRPTLPASANVESSTSKSALPSTITLNRLPENSTRSVYHLFLATS